jgi:hypothetical protein
LAAGSKKGCPGASIDEVPPLGIRKRTGPVQAFSFPAIHRPIRACSSADGRTSVTSGLWT